MLMQTTLLPGRHNCRGGPKTDPIRHVAGCIGCLRDINKWQRNLELGAIGAAPFRILQRWQATRNHLGTLHKAYAQSNTFKVPEIPAALPTFDATNELLKQMNRLYQQILNAEEHDRTLSWKNWVQSALKQSPKEFSRQLKETDFGCVTLMERPDGTLTGNIMEMDGLAHAAWDPIICRYVNTPEPDVDKFMATYSHLVPNVPMQVEPISSVTLRHGLQHVAVDTATGTDGWSVAHLRRLPTCILESLAKFLNLVEECGQWPSALAKGYISLIPKGEGMQPTSMRPLSVLSNVYRIWAGIRLEDVMKWQESWIHPYAYGFRSRKGTNDAYTLLNTMIELSLIAGQEFHLVGLDYVKCLDRIPQGIVLRVASTLGLDSAFALHLEPCTARCKEPSRLTRVSAPFSMPRMESCKAAR